MQSLPESVRKAWDNRKEPNIFTTVSEDNMPNAIYVTCVKWYNDMIVIADNKFHKTRRNIKSGSKGTLLFITKEGKSFQVKGRLEYQESGKLYDDMKNGWLEARYAGNAATVLYAEEVYSGAEKLL
jgi:predicted pyridoxine 5'-phosphate oxidase superfamily flavin-nucleotide-binding protein